MRALGLIISQHISKAKSWNSEVTRSASSTGKGEREHGLGNEHLFEKERGETEGLVFLKSRGKAEPQKGERRRAFSSSRSSL